MAGGFVGLILLIVFGLILLGMMVKILNEYERAVVFRLGRVLERPKGPGLILLIPVVDRAVRVSLRTVVLDIPPQDVITLDNVTLKVNAVVYFRVMDPLKAIIQVENYLYATSQFSQTTLRSVLGQAHLDEILAKGHAPQYIDYMSIDVEGAEYDALLGLSLDRYEIGTFTIEHNFETKKRDAIRTLLEGKGYVRVRVWEVEDWYVHPKIASRIPGFVAYCAKAACGVYPWR